MEGKDVVTVGATIKEERPKKVTIRAVKNGPDIVSVDGQAKMALCRCGQSGNKPLCDGTHRKVGFKAGQKDLTVVE